jgi:hypothetical protein
MKTFALVTYIAGEIPWRKREEDQPDAGFRTDRGKKLQGRFGEKGPGIAGALCPIQ